MKDLTVGLGGKNHAVYCDSYFSSPQLFEEMLGYGVYCCGTVNKNRKDYPGKELQKDSKKGNKETHWCCKKGTLWLQSGKTKKRCSF